MIPSSLRYTKRHLRRIGNRCFLPSNTNKARPSSRFLFDNTTRFISRDATTTNSSSIIHHTSRRRNYNAISVTTVQQFRNFSDNVPPETTTLSTPVELLVSNYNDLPDYYSSPLQLLTKRNMKTVQLTPLDSVTINNDTWYTASYETKFGPCPSGTFGTSTQTLNPTLASEQVMNINGINYYKSQQVAMEAAAARVIDMYAASMKLTPKFREDESLISLRYCVEVPELKEAQGEVELTSIKSSLDKFAWQLHAPINFLENIFRRLFGSTTAECFESQVLTLGSNRYHTATFTDPITSEVFHSGLVGKINAEQRESNTLRKPSLDEAQVHIENGLVYYPNEQLAKHAAAARAIDCYLFREGDAEVLKRYQLCLEEPYDGAEEGMLGGSIRSSGGRDDYDRLLSVRALMQQETCSSTTVSRAATVSAATRTSTTNLSKQDERPTLFKSSLDNYAYQLHNPMDFLSASFRRLHKVMYSDSAFQVESMVAEGKSWYTASFHDEIRDETFQAGLVKPLTTVKRRPGTSMAVVPPGGDKVYIKDGKVYYALTRNAKHAAAARAIDCYLYREGTNKFREKYQLCLEEPYFQGDAAQQQHDYDKLLNKRKIANSTFAKKEGGTTFKMIAEKFSYQLHAPVNFLENCYRQVFGSIYSKGAFQYEFENTTDGRAWCTATFTDPKTSEVFSSGLVQPINVATKQGSILSTPLGEAEVHVEDGKVYYTEEKFAKHAAAARAIDNYLFREGGDELTKKYQLCLEDPYNDVAERDSRHTDYDELLRKRSAAQSSSCADANDVKFSSITLSQDLEDNPWKLHIPMQLFNVHHAETRIFRTKVISFREDTDGLWHTATFTDPETSEVFHAGVGRRVDVEKKQGAFLSPSLDEVENRVADGKVYYRDAKLAKHAAAARAVDCYLYRDSGKFPKNQLCLEDPYEAGDAQEIYYNELAATRPSLSIMDASHILPVMIQPVQHRAEPDSKKEEKKEKVSFKSITNSAAPHLHVPVTLLEKCFRQGRGYMYPPESFHCDSFNMANGRTWYTATFTDPETLEKFSSGLAQPIDVEQKRGATLSTPLGEAEVHIMDGKVYYTEEKFARHAAAARAIDNYLFREGGDELTRKYQLCLEDPYNNVVERDSRHTDYDELLRQRSCATGVSSNAKPSVEVKHWDMLVPLAFLNTHLTEKYGVEHSISKLKQESVEIGMRTWHTATFIDPKTSEEFSSGLVTPINDDQGEGLLSALSEAEVRIVNGKVYYAKYRHAKHAAAARAIDCYFYRDEKTLGEVLKNQLCLEDPYKEGEVKAIDYDALVASRRDNTKSLDSAEDMMPYLDESDEDFTIISRTYSDQPTRVDQKLSTLGRIAEIWAETPSSTSISRSSAKMTSFSKASRDPTENILSWFKRVDHTPSTFEQAVAYGELCNKTLQALAKENAEKVINSNTSDAECAEIQKEAKSILDKLMSISSQLASAEESVVNAETLNAYIQCLSRFDVEGSVSAAEELLTRMSEGEDNLPSPNTGTFNAVMKLWSSMDGEKGKGGVNNAFSRLQNAAVTRDDLTPNRDTFQILLAANSKEDNHFKYDLALASLERIKALSQDLCGEAFIPGTDDYNAALKKTATNCLANGDNQPPWFWHGQQYDGGFKAMDDDKKCEALDMEKWLEHAEQVGATPSEDMYFQVIKAWASTGSLEGLIGGDGAHGAEELAQKAVLRSEGAPNMKMFYPIIAAWSLCGEKLGPDRVKEWIDQISSLGMKPDLDLHVAYFVAVEKWQSNLIANLLGNDGIDDSIDKGNVDEASSDGDIESLFKAAQNCSRYLKEITPNENRKDVADLDAFTSMLRYSIKAWGRASDSTLLLPDGSSSLDTKHGIEEMAKILKCMQLTNQGQDFASVDEALVNAAGEIYTEFTSQLRKLDATMNRLSDNSEKCYFADRVADVEKSLRSHEYHSRRLASTEKLSPESNTIRHNLYRETLRGCAGVKLSTDYGHMMRICTLIMDCLSWHHAQSREHGSSKEAEDVTDIYSDIAIISGICVKNPYERMNVLRSIYDRASDFFPKKNPHHESIYARVDRAALLGSMRRSLGDSEMTDSFLSSFEEGKQGQRRRSRQRGR